MTENKTHISNINGRIFEGVAPPTDEGPAGLTGSGQLFRNTTTNKLMVHIGSGVWKETSMTSTSTSTTTTSTSTS